MHFLALVALVGAANTADPGEIELGDPKRCLRVLAGLSCTSPGTVVFEGNRDEAGQLSELVVLPPHNGAGYNRVADCIVSNSSYFSRRFVVEKGESNSGNGVIYRYEVTPRIEVCGGE